MSPDAVPAATAGRRGLVTLGQSLGLLRPAGFGPLGRTSELRLSVAGAESNVAIGVSRLGRPATWIGHVGADPIGRMLLRELRAEGVDVRARVDRERPSALMLAERRTADQTRMSYYRTMAAGVGLGPADIESAAFTDGGILHVTGITPCLGDGPAAAVDRAIELARAHGMPVSLDLNHRVALADGPTFARRLAPLLGTADILFATIEEAATVLGRGVNRDHVDNAGDLAAELSDRGPTTVVLKQGANGSRLWTAAGLVHQPAVRVTVVDTVGAGDAFAAGFLAARLDGLDELAQLGQASRTAAISVSSPGDWEGLPTSRELTDFDPGTDISR